MKVCDICDTEICTRDGENRCSECEDKELGALRTRRNMRAQALRDLGLVRVRGALGGVYWE